jgi:hypothetical protein
MTASVRRACLLILAIVAFNMAGANAFADDIVKFITPEGVEATAGNSSGSHMVMRRANAAPELLLIFLTGTGGASDRGPMPFFRTALGQGYRVVNLSYIDVPAVAQACNRLRDASNCAELFRRKRAFGEQVTDVINDRPDDAIVPRITALLRSLAKLYPADDWSQYLDADGSVRWRRIALSGLSQGGGMAAMIAKRYEVARVIDFSGGWDSQTSNSGIASWYSAPSITPPSRWYGTFHKDEAMAARIYDTYKALQIPDAHIVQFDDPSAKIPAHIRGVVDPVNRPIWQTLLGNGTLTAPD